MASVARPHKFAFPRTSGYGSKVFYSFDDRPSLNFMVKESRGVLVTYLEVIRSLTIRRRGEDTHALGNENSNFNSIIYLIRGRYH
jgi:hypothetical protein